MFDDDWGLESKEVSPLGEEFSLFDKPNKVERGRILEVHSLESILQQQISQRMAHSHHDGKFDGKSDEGFFVGYSLSSKAFRVYNTRTRRVEANLHIGFLENKPMIEGNGPKWLFDIDSLPQSMNYVLVAARTITNESTYASYFDSPSKDVGNGEPKSAAHDQKSLKNGPDNENDENQKSDSRVVMFHEARRWKSKGTD
ncbi:retrovirus-related pol polyprotein from transposon TNT 1-94 [Tanacetum coccineum]